MRFMSSRQEMPNPIQQLHTSRGLGIRIWLARVNG